MQSDSQATFKSIQSTILVNLQKDKSDEYCKKLFHSLTNTFNFRNNKYTYCGSYDLSQWLVLCFNSMVNEELFSEIVLPLVAYISIVDDACDEKITQFSIDEMKCHCRIFKGETVEASNPALKMGVHVYELIKEAKFDSIREKTLEFLKTGTELIETALKECKGNGQVTKVIENALEENGRVTEDKLKQFLEKRRIDSMASLFITINNFFKGISEIDVAQHLKHYNELACDIISLMNDVASIAKDTNKVVNNYVILNFGLKENNKWKRDLLYSELKKLPMKEFETSLSQVLDLISNKLTEMQKIKSANPSQSREFESIDEVMNGYCTWCIISKRFSHANHLLSEFHSKKSVFKTMIETILMPFLKPWRENDMMTYLDDIELSMKKNIFTEIFSSLVNSVGKMCSFSMEF